MRISVRSAHPYVRAAAAFTLLAVALLATGALANTPITDITINRAVVSEPVSFPGTSVEALAFSPDSQTLACGLGDGRVVLLDVQSASQSASLALHEAAITALSYAPDGQWLAASDISGRLIVWETEIWEPTTSRDVGASIHDAAFSPQGTWLMCVGEMRSVLMWEAGTWKRLPPIIGHAGTVYAFAVSPEEDLLVTGAGDADPSIRVWSLPDGRLLRDDLYEGRVHDIEYSSRDPHATIAGTQLPVWLWLVDEGEVLHLITGSRDPATDTAYSSRGNAVVAVDEAGGLRFVPVPSIYVRRKISFDEALAAVDYSPDRLAIACGDVAGNVFLLTIP